MRKGILLTAAAVVMMTFAACGNFDPTVIFNDYETFITKVAYRILSL